MSVAKSGPLTRAEFRELLLNLHVAQCGQMDFEPFCAYVTRLHSLPLGSKAYRLPTEEELRRLYEEMQTRYPAIKALNDRYAAYGVEDAL